MGSTSLNGHVSGHVLRLWKPTFTDKVFLARRHPSNSIILPDKGIQSEHMKLLVNEEGQVNPVHTGIAAYDCGGI